MLQVIHILGMKAAIGPFSQAIRAGNLIFTSGQMPLDPVSGEVVSGTIEDQTCKVMENIQMVLQAAGSDLSEVVKTTVFIKNMDDFSRMNAVYVKYFATNPPARSCVEVARLPKDVDIEIEAVAYIVD